jgi:hypothetical protein
MLQFPAYAFRQSRLRLTVNTEDLLADGVRPPGQETRLGRSAPVFDTENSGNFDAFAAEVSDQSISGGIAADSRDGHNPGAKGGQIIGGISPAARDEMCFAVAKNQDRSFAGNAGNFTKLKFVGDEIAKENDRLRRKLFDAIGEGEKVDGG